MEKPRGLLFDATGGLFMYSHGIANYLEDTFQIDDLEFIGISGGCQPAMFLSSGIGMNTALNEWFIPTINDVNKENSYYSYPIPKMIEYSKHHLGKLMTEKEMERVQNRLWVSYTNLYFNNIFVNTYKDYDDLFDVIKATQYIPFLGGNPLVKHNDSWVFDGWMSKCTLPEGKWIVVNPFLWGRYRYWQGLHSLTYICNEERQLEIRRHGYEDAKKNNNFFIENGLIPKSN